MAYILPPPPFDIEDKVLLKQWLYELYKRNLTILDDATTVDELGDVVITSIADNEILQWDSGSSTWINQTLAESNIGNVNNTGTPVDNQLAVWTAASTIEGDSNLTWSGSLLTVGGALTVTGAFTSLGIDDNCTAERMQLGDSLMVLGAAGGGYTIAQPVQDQALFVSGGNAFNDGGNVAMFGPSHGLAGDIYLRSGANSIFIWDESTGILTLSTGNGSKTLALKLTAAQSVQPISFKLPLETTTNLEDVTHAINTGAAKEQGTVIYNSTTDNPVYAVAAADNSVWVGADGSTLHTPV